LLDLSATLPSLTLEIVFDRLGAQTSDGAEYDRLSDAWRQGKKHYRKKRITMAA